MGGACGMCGRQEKCIQGFAARPAAKRPLGKPEQRLEDNIKMDPQEVGWEHRLDLIGSEQGQVADSCGCSENVWVP